MHTRLGWTSPILSFLWDGRLPPNPEEAKKIQKRAIRFTILTDELYKRGYSQPYLRCIEEEEAKYVLEEVHRGGVVCGDHMGSKSLVRKIMKAGYFWPTMQQDVANFVKKCDSCQRYRNVHRVPREKMTTIFSLWPFAQWGINIMGPLPQGKRQMKFLLTTSWSGSKWKLLQRSQRQRYKILYGKYFFQVRDTKDDHFRKGSLVWQSWVQIILFKPRHQKQVLITRTSSGQWTDRSN